jgi:hypothetical protein
MFRLFFYPVFDSYLLVAVVALVLAGLMLFGPSREKTRRGQRAAIALLRAVVIALVLLAMLQPTLVYTHTEKQAATLVVLVDQSRSMTVADAVGGKTRWDALRFALTDAAPALAKLQKDFTLKAYTFDGDVHEVRAERGDVKLPDKPEGRQTAIGAALDEVLRREAGKRLLGVVLLSDGAQRAYAPHDLPPQIAAARFKPLGCPLFTLPFGQSRGLGDARDVAVESLVVSPSVFVKNELTVAGDVRVDGYVNVDIPVQVWFEPSTKEPVASQTIRADADGQRFPIRLSFTPEVPGEYKVTLRAVVQPNELVTTNNELSTFVNVLKGGLNVLYIEGALRPETSRIRRALDSSRDIKVDYVRLNPRDTKPHPADFADRFKPGKYDAYIIGDVDSTAFQGNELAELADCVNRGAGLIMLGGFQTFGPGGYAETPLAKVLPVGMDANERQGGDEAMRADVQWPGPLKMQPTKLGLMHFALRLAAKPGENESLWSKLPELEGANKFHNLAQGATVLADAGPDKPLLVAHSFGAGRVMAFAGDSTWQWQMEGFEPAHKRFWRQIVLWLARKDQAQEGTVWIRMGQRRFAPSQPVEFYVGATSPTGDPVADAEFKAQIVSPGSDIPKELPLARQGEQMVGSFADTQKDGDYAIEVTATQKEQPLGSARARFLVSKQDVELDNASADAATLGSLAAMTGGKSLAPEELPKLIRSLAENTQQLDVQRETKKTFWDTWPFLLVVVALLGVEWYLRKRWGLV